MAVIARLDRGHATGSGVCAATCYVIARGTSSCDNHGSIDDLLSCEYLELSHGTSIPTHPQHAAAAVIPSRAEPPYIALNLTFPRIIGSAGCDCSGCECLAAPSDDTESHTESHFPTTLPTDTTDIIVSPYDYAYSGSLPSELGILTKLTHIDLEYNYLTGTLPSELGSLTALREGIVL